MWNVECLEGEPGKVVGEVIGLRGDFLPESDDLSFPVLRLVDPYDDTVFNRLQTRVLMDEWQRLEEKAKQTGEHEHWQKIRTLAERVTAEPLRYLRFVGD